MPRIINVHFLPQLADPHQMAGHPIVVVDILRASTTIVHALGNGAARVVPCLTVAEARDLAKQWVDPTTGSPALLGGERGGEPIAGFNFGNSPAEYARSLVADRTVIFTTTNGTKALMACIGASRVLIGAFVNLAAVCTSLRDEPRVEILCAGTDGKITREDVLFAGACVAMLCPTNDECQTNDEARLAAAAWSDFASSCRADDRSEQLAKTLRRTLGGENLIKIGRQSDLELAAEIDRYRIVPELDRGNWTIVAG